jgi:hypothetical protein
MVLVKTVTVDISLSVNTLILLPGVGLGGSPISLLLPLILSQLVQQ